MARSSETSELHLCSKCIGNTQLAAWIRKNGTRGKCDFDSSHGSSKRVVTIDAITEQVDHYFRENYQRGAEYAYGTDDSDNASYDTYGETYEEILAHDLECDEDVLAAIVKSLLNYDWADFSSGEEPFYDEWTNYELTVDAESRSKSELEEYWYENRFSFAWEDFCKTVQFERRFFKTKKLLDKLFGKPAEYDSGAVKPVYILKSGQKIFRARILDDDFDETRLDKNPAAELSAPPKEKARAGRMNVEYIPAFYGAFDHDTAISEMRPSIEDNVAVGEFVLQKDIKVFDFSVFSKVFEKLEGDKWKEVIKHTRYDFIKQMESEISKPVLAFQKQREYIATQIVAEYLREYFACDAVIYRSSVHKNHDVDNRNIVIFYKNKNFVGKNNLLSLIKHRICIIRNVVYDTYVIPF